MVGLGNSVAHQILEETNPTDDKVVIFENYLCNEPQVDLIPALSLNCTIFCIYYLLYKCVLVRKKIPMSSKISCMMCINQLIFVSKALFWISLSVVFHYGLLKYTVEEIQLLRMYLQSSYLFISCILNMVIYIFTVAVMFKLKKIELTMSPKYETVQMVLREIAKFKCLSYTFLLICVIFMSLVAILFSVHMLGKLNGLLSTVWIYVICSFNLICYIFFAKASNYLM